MALEIRGKMSIFEFGVKCHLKAKLFREWFQNDKNDGLSFEILIPFNIIQYLTVSPKVKGEFFQRIRKKIASHLQLKAHLKRQLNLVKPARQFKQKICTPIKPSSDDQISNFLLSTSRLLSEAVGVERGEKKGADFHLSICNRLVDATQEGIKAAFLRDLDLHTFPVSRYTQRLLTHMHTRGTAGYRTVTALDWAHQDPRAFDSIWHSKKCGLWTTDVNVKLWFKHHGMLSYSPPLKLTQLVSVRKKRLLIKLW